MKRAVNYFLKLVAILALLSIAWLVYAVAANWGDQQPSSTALEFEAYYQEHFPLEVENNGYAFMVGFDVQPEEDPLYWGETRIAWTHSVFDLVGDDELEYVFPGAQAEFFVESLPGMELLSNHCKPSTSDCIKTVVDNSEEIALTIKEGRWVIDRYSDLIEHRTWVENIYLDVRLPFPGYQHFLDAQRLYMADIFMRRDTLSAEDIRQALEKDLIFWRRVQQDSAILITKMISLVAIQQNFYWTNQLICHSPVDEQFNLLSHTHQTPLGKNELSMYRVLVGEWTFGSRFIFDVPEEMAEWGDEYANLSRARVFFQFQATVNLMAEQHAALLRHIDRPLDEYPHALASMDQIYNQESQLGYFFKPANAVGRILVAVAAPAYGDYFVRVSDIEGQRRALVLVHQLRQQQIPLDQVAEAIAASDIRNPYTGDAFEWDAELQAVVFTGLQRGDRARQVFEL